VGGKKSIIMKYSGNKKPHQSGGSGRKGRTFIFLKKFENLKDFC
jgi:hypothetical protein